MMSPKKNQNLLSPITHGNGNASPYSQHSWSPVPEIQPDSDGMFPDPRDMFVQSPFSSGSSNVSLYSGSASGSPREFMTHDNEGVLRHLGKKGKVWSMGKRGNAKFVRINHQWHIKFLDSEEQYPVVEEAGALCVEFTKRAFDYIMEIGDSMDDASEYIVWKGNGKPLSPLGSRQFNPRSPRTWVSIRQRSVMERTNIILAEAKYAFMTYESTVLDVIENKGRTVMWSTVPKGFKNRYNCTDLKTIGQWRQVEDYGMDLRLLKKGMKIKMVIMGVVAGGKYSEEPQLNGVPDPQLWGHYIMTQVGPQGFSHNIPQGMKSEPRKSVKEPTFPITKPRSASRARRKNTRLNDKHGRFPKRAPVKITQPKKPVPPRLSNEESFPALGAAPKKSPSVKKTKGAWSNAARLRNLSKFNYATVLSSCDTESGRTSTIRSRKSTLSNARSTWARVSVDRFARMD